MNWHALVKLSHDDDTALSIAPACYRKAAGLPHSSVKGICCAVSSSGAAGSFFQIAWRCALRAQMHCFIYTCNMRDWGLERTSCDVLSRTEHCMSDGDSYLVTTG